MIIILHTLFVAASLNKWHAINIMFSAMLCINKVRLTFSPGFFSTDAIDVRIATAQSTG